MLLVCSLQRQDDGISEEVDSIPGSSPQSLFHSRVPPRPPTPYSAAWIFTWELIFSLYWKGKDKFLFDRYRDVSFLRLIETFLDSAPHATFSSTCTIVVLEDIPEKEVTAVAVIISMISLALTLTEYISAGKDILHHD